MDETIQVLLTQIVATAILLVALLQVLILFFASIKQQINAKEIFSMERLLLQKRIEQKALEANLIQQQNNNSWLGFRKFSVDKKVVEQKSGICSFFLTPHDGKPIPTFNPGQHLFFRINIPSHKKTLLRCYSISSSPLEKNFYQISVKKSLPPLEQPTAPQGIVSNYFYDHLKQGDIIDVRAPSGKFFINLLSHKPVVLIAGGIGLTPLLSMLNAICDTDAQREVWLFFSVKNKQNHFMRGHLQQIATKFENIHIHTCYSKPKSADIKGLDYDHAGRINAALLKAQLPSNNFEFYLCGPNSMIETLRIDLIDWGVPTQDIHDERFSQPVVQKKPEALNVGKTTATIQFSTSKKSFAWNDKADSILDLALSGGVNINYSCKRGMCGLCQTTVKSGEVYYDEEPEYLSNLEQGMCLPCVAKTKKDLELYA